MGVFDRAWKFLNSPVKLPGLSLPGRRNPMAILPPTQGRPPVSEESRSLTSPGVAASWNTSQCLEQGMAWSGTAAACMDFRAKQIAQLDWTVEQWVGPGPDDWKPIPNHPWVELMMEPNPEVSSGELLYRTVTHLDLVGLAYWFLVPSTIDPKVPLSEVWGLQPDKVQILKPEDPTQYIGGYNYRPSTRVPWRPYDKKQICCFRYPHPADPLAGMGILERGAPVLDVDRTMQSYVWNSLQNRAVKDGILSVKQLLTPERHAEISQQIRQSVAGPGNTRGIVVVDAEATYQPISGTPAELDLRESQDAYVERVCSQFGVLPPCIGYFKNATYNNVESAHTMTWVNTLIPLAITLCDAMNLQILRPWYRKNKRLRVVPDLSKVPALIKLLDVKADTAKKYWSMAIPFDELNKRLDLGFRDGIEGADKGYLPGSMVSSETINEPAPNPFADTPPPFADPQQDPNTEDPKNPPPGSVDKPNGNK